MRDIFLKENVALFKNLNGVCFLIRDDKIAFFIYYKYYIFIYKFLKIIWMNDLLVSAARHGLSSGSFRSGLLNAHAIFQLVSKVVDGAFRTLLDLIKNFNIGVRGSFVLDESVLFFARQFGSEGDRRYSEKD